MEIKRNEATYNRPEGDRVLDAPYVFVDIKEFTDQLKDEKAWEKSDRNAITVFKGENLTIVISALREGASIIDKQVDGLITLQVLKGKIRVSTPDGDVDADEHKMIAFHPGVHHSVKALSQSVVLITNHSNDDRLTDKTV